MNPLPSNRKYLFLIVTVATLSIDLWSKHEAFRTLGLFGRSGWLLDSWVRFEFHTNLNPGALWGMGQGFSGVFACMSVLAFCGIVYWLFMLRAAESLWMTWSLSLVSGGTLGNLYDRLGLHGVRFPDPDRPGELMAEPARAVRDFFHFKFGNFDWAIFNVADICLVTGAIMLMLHSLMQPTSAASPIQPELRPDARPANAAPAGRTSGH
jgi:signal peptidase II